MSFFANRLIRILPVLWATMPFVLVLEYYGHALHVAPKWFVPVLIANLLCLPTIVPVPLLHYAAWSMSYELAFYATAAIAVFMWNRGHLQTLFVVPPAILLLVLYPRALFFLPGLLVAEGMLDLPFIRPLARFPLIFILIFLAAWSQVRTEGDLHASMVSWPGVRFLFAVPAVLAACLAFQGIVAGAGFTGVLFRKPIMQFLGTISYSLYMWQFVTMAVIKHAMLNLGMLPALGAWSQVALLAFSIPSTLLVSWVSQLFLEQGVSRWLRRRAKRYFTSPGCIAVLVTGPIGAGNTGDNNKAYESRGNVA